MQKILYATLFLSLGLLYVPSVFSVAGDVQLDVSTGGQIIGSALITNKFTDAANTDYYLDPAASTTSLTVAGNVGIGTTGPAWKLQVGAGTALNPISTAVAIFNANVPISNIVGNLNVYTTDAIALNKGAMITMGGLGGAATQWPFAAIAGRSENNSYAGYLQFLTTASNGANAEYMRITSTGNVGIGTTGPAAKLDVAGALNTGGSAAVLAKNSANYSVQSPPSDIRASVAGVGMYDPTAGIYSPGVYGWVPTGGHGGLASAAIFDRPDNTTRLFVGNGYMMQAYDTSTATNDFILDYSGNVGIGMIPVGNRRLDIKAQTSGAGNYVIATTDASSAYNPFWIRDDGAGYLQAAAWAYGSDRRLKENIVNIGDSGLDIISKLNPVKFDYINGQKGQLGFIAQEVQQVIPEAVEVADPKTGMLGLKTDFIIPYLVKGMQEQQREITLLFDQLAKLIVDGVDILKKLNELSVKVENQQGQIKELQKEIEGLKK